jgi:hypothetical protein
MPVARVVDPSLRTLNSHATKLLTQGDGSGYPAARKAHTRLVASTRTARSG